MENSFSTDENRWKLICCKFSCEQEGDFLVISCVSHVCLNSKYISMTCESLVSKFFFKRAGKIVTLQVFAWRRMFFFEFGPEPGWQSSIFVEHRMYNDEFCCCLHCVYVPSPRVPTRLSATRASLIPRSRNSQDTFGVQLVRKMYRVLTYLDARVVLLVWGPGPTVGLGLVWEKEGKSLVWCWSPSETGVQGSLSSSIPSIFRSMGVGIELMSVSAESGVASDGCPTGDNVWDVDFRKR